MGRQIKRVPLDFDWPLNRVWPGYMVSICTEEIAYATKTQYEATDDDNPCCRACRHFARLAGLPIKGHGCPDHEHHPLVGVGWQLWETVTEGSPISPVFATPEDLRDWMLAPERDGWYGDDGDGILKWITGTGWAPSLVAQNGLVTSGVEHDAGG